MKRHSTDLVSLAFGLIFAGIAGWWLLGRYVENLHVNIPNLGLFVAGALIVLGLLGVFGSLRRERRPEPFQQTIPVPAAGGAAEQTVPDPATTHSDVAAAVGTDSDVEEFAYPRADTDTAELADPVPPSEEDKRR